MKILYCILEERNEEGNVEKIVQIRRILWKRDPPLRIVDKLHRYKSHLELIYLIYNRTNRTFITQLVVRITSKSKDVHQMPHTFSLVGPNLL